MTTSDERQVRDGRFDILPLPEWMPGDVHPSVIAGPCSAETEAQVLETAAALREIEQVKAFRAGVWKPRTRPGNFQGLGIKALPWLARVREETGLPVACEVATGEHVRACLDFGIEILWIGARTTTSPFAVSQIAGALRGADVAVLVKNPMNPEPALWLGALERVRDAGIRKLGAIHRGFNTHEKSQWRNAPMWEIPIELIRDHPEVPLFCDPSHIAGARGTLGLLSQEACDLEMAGLMIETHIRPDDALTDRDQQITPAELASLLAGLTVRDPETEDLEFISRMHALRLTIDEVDENIIDALAKRFAIVREMAEVKKERGATILQASRWKEVIESRIRKGSERGISPEFLTEVLRHIHEEAIKLQHDIMNPG